MVLVMITAIAITGESETQQVSRQDSAQTRFLQNMDATFLARSYTVEPELEANEVPGFVTVMFLAKFECHDTCNFNERF